MDPSEETLEQFLKRTQREKRNARARERRRMIRESDPIIQHMKAKKEEEKEEKIKKNFSKMLDKAQRKAEAPERKKLKEIKKQVKEAEKKAGITKRLVKGSEEAKAWGKRMAELKKAKSSG